MSAYLTQWLQYAARWLHVLAGAVWVGTSFYFVWLNHSLRSPATPREGIAGELESVHGGAFYRVEKGAGPPTSLPRELHWFKWEAYVTWLSGAALLVLVYYLGSGAVLRDPAVSSIGQGAAVALGVATLVGGWLVYDGLCRTALVERPVALAVVLAAFVGAVTWGLGHALSGRATYIHVGAMIGTWMAANVFLVIIPGQRAMVAALEAGRAPDPERGRRGAQRSLHNNYLTLPVVFLMVGIHYPVAYTSPRAWLIVVGVAAASVLARVYYNERHAGRRRGWALVAAGVLVVALVAGVAPHGAFRRPEAPAAGGSRGESFAVVRAIVAERCVACHATRPARPEYPAPPLGVVLETPDEIRVRAERILDLVGSGAMPLGNVTGMTDAERSIVVDWARSATGEPAR